MNGIPMMRRVTGTGLHPVSICRYTAAEEMRSDLRSSGGAIAAADFVEEVFEKAK